MIWRRVAFVIIAMAVIVCACGDASTVSVIATGVIQFQDLAYWGGYASTGNRIEGLGHDAVLSRNEPGLFVRDIERGRVIMFLAAHRPVGYVDSLVQVAALIYGKAPASVRVDGTSEGAAAELDKGR